MERRNFILAAGGLIGAPVVAHAASLAAIPAAAPAIGMAAFRELVGQQFIAYEGKRGSALELVAVRPGKAAPHHEQFSLLFAGSPGLGAGIYEIDNPLTGCQAIYLEPAGAAKAGRASSLYRADFSLLV